MQQTRFQFFTGGYFQIIFSKIILRVTKKQKYNWATVDHCSPLYFFVAWANKLPNPSNSHLLKASPRPNNNKSLPSAPRRPPPPHLLHPPDNPRPPPAHPLVPLQGEFNPRCPSLGSHPVVPAPYLANRDISFPPLPNSPNRWVLNQRKLAKMIMEAKVNFPWSLLCLPHYGSSSLFDNIAALL